MLHCLCGTVEREAQVNQTVFLGDKPKLESVNNKAIIDGQGAVLMDKNDRHVVVLNAEESVEIAKAILRYHKVPFCNRVEGAGLKD